jgi:iron complex outermembrane recepter protein
MSVLKNSVSLAVLAAVLAPAVADQSTAGSDDQSLIETVVVTAQKREQNPIDVPFALTAYSGKFLKDVGIQEFDKLSLFVPGFVVQNQSPNNPGFGLRGLTLDSGEAAQEPRVSVFEDGVSISTTRATYIEMFDVERIEVAKGPQTTLFGRAALMGGVNVIQNKANLDSFSASVGAETGDYNYHMVEGAVNMPLTDDMALRISGRYKSRDGYVRNLNDGEKYNSVNTGAARVAFAWHPTENFRADIISNFEEDSPSGTSFKSGTYYPSNATTGTVLGNLDHTSGAALTDSVSGFENGKRLGLDRKVWDVKALTTYKIDPALTLSTVTAYRRFDSEEVFDPDGFSKPLLQAAEDERGDQISHEMRLNYNDGGRLSGFVGVDYFYSNVSQRVPMQFDERLVVALLGGSATYAALNAAPTSWFGGATYLGGYAPAILQGVVSSTAYSYASKTLGYTVAQAQAFATTV